MAKRPTIQSTKRQIFGRKVKALRRDGHLPANVFGKKIKSQALTVSLQDFQKTFSEVGETGLVDLMVDKEAESRPSLISNVQINPVTDNPIHADFHQVDLTQKVTANVPVEVIGESPAVKDKGAILITLFDEVEVEALPTDLPSKFEVDISSLKDFNDSIDAKDLKVDRSKVDIKVDDSESIVMAQEPKEEEEEAPAAAPAEGEEAEAVEGEEGAPAEAEAKEGDQEPSKDDKSAKQGDAKPAEPPKSEAKKS